VDGALRRVEKVGVEQTGSYIVGHMALAGIPVLDVTRPDRTDRRAPQGRPARRRPLGRPRWRP
jgi:hypothetical protein